VIIDNAKVPTEQALLTTVRLMWLIKNMMDDKRRADSNMRILAQLTGCYGP